MVEYNVAIKNNVHERILQTEKCLQHNIKWAKLSQNLFYIMLNIYWEGNTSKCY